METKDIISIVSVIIGGVSLFFSIREYIKRGNKDRAEFFLRLRDRFKQDELYMKIQTLVEADDDAELKKIPAQEINRLIGFYEEVYLFSKSNILSKDVVFYMFGQYALDCYENISLNEMVGLDKQPYWKQFVAFCKEYKAWKATEPTFEFKI